MKKLNTLMIKNPNLMEASGWPEHEDGFPSYVKATPKAWKNWFKEANENFNIFIVVFNGEESEITAVATDENFSSVWHETFQLYEEKYGHKEFTKKFSIKWMKFK